MPGDEKTLAAIGAIAAGESRARLYVTPGAPDEGKRALRLCVRGTPGAVRVTGPLGAYADLLLRQTQNAMHRAAAQRQKAGDTVQARTLKGMAGALPAAKRAADKTTTGSGSVRTVSGGLPTLGKRR
ncbi:hypothetical protein OG548_45705 [Streptomyces sp. NBC_01356]|uniref:hypothetical protein n=1 Tax=Streptomyces sp. NBC_01356 TaxID=2903836 RepID=UPI002E35A5FC|nr:hypothetical protein [Streptomyces sp. NBC_01356]